MPKFILMKFSQRLAYYLLGLLIGSTIVFYFWGSKETDFCYLPNCRTLKDIRSKPLTMSPEAKNAMENVFTIDQLTQYLTNGDVDFDNSKKPEDGGKLYLINAVDSLGNPLQIQVINYSEKVKIKSIEYIK